MTTKLLLAGLATAAMLAIALPAAAQTLSYPYSYFVGPGYFVGGGGFYQGTVFNPYQAYGQGTFYYNAMTGQGSFGSGYGSNSGYGTNYGGCNPYIPTNACGIISHYTQYGSTMYGMGYTY